MDLPTEDTSTPGSFNFFVNGVASEDAARLQERAGHISVAFNNTVITWGGYNSQNLMDDRYMDPAELLVYQTQLNTWYKYKTSGQNPPKCCGCAAVIVDSNLYVFGGFFGEQDRYHAAQYACTLHLLDLSSLRWSSLPIRNHKVPSPRHKFAGWHHERKLYFFGGYGQWIPLDHVYCDTLEFFKENEVLNNAGWFEADVQSLDGAWNNQLVVYDLNTGCWTNPKCGGSVPCPRAAHTAVKLSHRNEVILFGGRFKNTRLNDLYLYHCDINAWSEVHMTGDVPCGRSWMSMVETTPGRLVVYGGFSSENVPLGDCFVLDVQSREWTRLSFPPNRPLLWHSASSVAGAAYMFGGCKTNLLDIELETVFSNDLVVVRVEPDKLLNLSLQRIVSSSKLRQNSLQAFDHATALPIQLVMKLKLALGHKTIMSKLPSLSMLSIL